MLIIRSVDASKTKFAALAAPACEDVALHSDPTIRALVEKASAQASFQGRTKDEVVFFDPEGLPTRVILIYGMGKRKDLTAESFRAAAGKAVKKCVNMGVSDLAFATPDVENLPVSSAAMLEALLEGAFLGNHVFDRYKDKKELTPLKEFTALVDSSAIERHKDLPGRVEAVCAATLQAREWVNMPSNEKRPELLANAIAEQAQKHGLTVTVLDEKALKTRKLGAMLAVAAGSGSRPRLVVLSHEPKNAKRTVALVGKGITFDSGGLNLKPSNSLEGMKADMAGAAAVAGALVALADSGYENRVIGVLPLVENMISGDATRPGDIVASYAGKTVEIGNTDAEGRLVLIDAMAWALKQYKPDLLIDMATLTGACLVALGEKIAAVFSRDDALAESVVSAGRETHERCWRMPLPEDYRELIKSDFADISNIPSTRWGGAITAALFLEEFIEDSRWAHIDIAGPAYHKKPSEYCGPGGTGFGVRLLCRLLRDLDLP